MRILHVTDTFLPRLGGIELHVADLARRQRAAGHTVLVLTAERLAAAAGSLDVPVHRLRTGPTGAGLGVRLGPVVAHFGPDVIHAHLSVGSPFVWAVLRNTRGIPTVASLHSLLPHAPALVRAGIRVTGLPIGRITFTAVSEVAAQRLRAALGPTHRVQVLHNGIDPATWAVAHEPSSEFSIVSVGRLVARKRPLVLVEALADLASRVPELRWSATIIGDGSQRAKVAAAVRSRDLEDRVRLPGALSRAEIRRHLAGADAAMAVATLESFGIAALEARCAGVPIVGMAASGITEFVTDGVNGLLAARDRDLGLCLARLATDPVLAEQLRAHNTAGPVPMTWDTVLGDHDQVYERARRTTPTSVVRARSVSGSTTRHW